MVILIILLKFVKNARPCVQLASIHQKFACLVVQISIGQLYQIQINIVLVSMDFKKILLIYASTVVVQTEKISY